MTGMEKNEKIEKTEKRRFRILLAFIAVLLVIAALLPTEAQDQEGTETSVSEEELVEMVDSLDAKVRKLKSRPGVIMEVDVEGMAAAAELQQATRLLLSKRYGAEEPYRIQLDLEFTKNIPDFEQKGSKGRIVLEMAPSRLVPHSIFYFLEIARSYTGGAFHRNAPHVLQARVDKAPVKHLAFQEYSKEYPHVKGTVGYAGRPSGPEWYVSIVDNSRNHGPGSQQNANPYEADSCFGRVIEGFEDILLERVTKMRNMGDKMGMVEDPQNQVHIRSMTIKVIPQLLESLTFSENGISCATILPTSTNASPAFYPADRHTSVFTLVF